MSTSNLLEVMSKNLPDAPAQIPPMVKLSGIPLFTVITLLSIPPISSTVASPFAGANSANYTKITINGVLNNCYYLNLSGTWSDLIWESEEQNKQAKGLTLDEFSTHTNFANYDLSLVYNKGFYADNETDYSYVDGYTWVIIEGKPVIVSTLVDTISQRDYIGKSKKSSYKLYLSRQSNIKFLL